MTPTFSMFHSSFVTDARQWRGQRDSYMLRPGNATRADHLALTAFPGGLAAMLN